MPAIRSPMAEESNQHAGQSALTRRKALIDATATTTTLDDDGGEENNNNENTKPVERKQVRPVVMPKHTSSSRTHNNKAPSHDSLMTRIWELEGEVSALDRKLERAQTINEQQVMDAIHIKEMEYKTQMEEKNHEMAMLREMHATELKARDQELAAKGEEIARLTVLITSSENEDKKAVQEATELMSQLQVQLDEAKELARTEILAQEQELVKLRKELARKQQQQPHQKPVVVAVQKPIHDVSKRITKKIPTAVVPSQRQPSPPPPVSTTRIDDDDVLIQNEGLRASLWRERGERVQETTRRDVEIEIAQQRSDEAVARALNAVRMIKQHGGERRTRNQQVVEPPPPPPPSRYSPQNNGTSTTNTTTMLRRTLVANKNRKNGLLGGG